jgi:hypothetical protein
MAEIHLKMVEYAQFKFDHLFWSNFVQFDRNSIHGWFVCADSGEILFIEKRTTDSFLGAQNVETLKISSKSEYFQNQNWSKFTTFSEFYT